MLYSKDGEDEDSLESRLRNLLNWYDDIRYTKDSASKKECLEELYEVLEEYGVVVFSTTYVGYNIDEVKDSIVRWISYFIMRLKGNKLNLEINNWTRYIIRDLKGFKPSRVKKKDRPKAVYKAENKKKKGCQLKNFSGEEEVHEENEKPMTEYGMDFDTLVDERQTHEVSDMDLMLQGIVEKYMKRVDGYLSFKEEAMQNLSCFLAINSLLTDVNVAGIKDKRLGFVLSYLKNEFKNQVSEEYKGG